MKRFFLIISIFLSSYFAQGQQAAMYTHYAFNTLAINPAYAGTRDALTITALHRSQWVGFPGAPTTQTLTLHTPIFTDNTGLGLSLVNDKIGPTRTTSFYVDFSYRIRVTGTSWLSFGLKGGINLRKIDLTTLSTETAYDPALLSDIKSEVLPNFGFGLYYFTHRYYLGVSIPKLLENNFKDNIAEGTVNLGSESKHYFFIAGAVFNLSEDVLLKPTGFVKFVTGAPIEGDLTANFIFHDRFRIGAMFRTGAAFGLLAGINITDQLSLGYSYDWSFTNTTGKYNSGSHEIMLRYDFIFKEKKKIRSPRYF